MATYDVLIVGAGPAGCSAALTLRNRDKSVLMAYTGDGAMGLAEKMNNYPGLRGKTGREMIELFRAEAQEAGAELRKEKVSQLLSMGDTFSAIVGSEIVSARAVILTVGTARGKELPGEKELVGRGVSYCATCDAMLYRKRPVIVIGTDEESVEEANFLAGLASRVMYLCEKQHDVSALDERVERSTAKPQAIEKGDGAPGQAIRVITDQGAVSADCAFVLRPTVAPGTLLPGLETSNAGIVHTPDLRTNVPRVYVAGDAAGAPRQVAKAVGDGCVAAFSCVEDLKQLS
ncbi:MAG: NAD(P)/FAD-dependent oxidoreductase [Clostridia bacterium]|nr:NAD(P)/FAD-dependent oxidoreductase [Clostridia bacterium]